MNQLRAEGVDTIFGLPGVQIMAAFDALYQQRNAIRLIHTRHEQATTYMADGYASTEEREPPTASKKNGFERLENSCSNV